jgi:hypothetical protein
MHGPLLAFEAANEHVLTRAGRVWRPIPISDKTMNAMNSQT